MNNTHLNVLLADDDLDDCNFFKQALGALPLNSDLSIVNDGEQLMIYLEENAENLPNVLFLDLNMPRKNGMECLSAIKRSQTLKEMPVVIFSTSNDKHKIEMVFKSGGLVYVHKPGDFSQLKQVILHALPIAVENIYSNSPLKYILNA